MVYNEADLLPVWRRHYAGQVGAAHCYVIDHGSDDGSTGDLGPMSVIRLPRSEQEDTRRTRAVSRLCAALLCFYDAVLYTDVDEIVVADPARFADLRAYAAAMPAEVVTAIGLELVQVRAVEAAIDPGQPILAQRRWVRFASALCKPVLTRRPVDWAPGFHCADAPMLFDALYLFHLRYYDLDQGLRRLARTRTMPWGHPDAAPHQRMGDAAWTALLDAFAGGPVLEGVAFDPQVAPLRTWLHATRDSGATRAGAIYTLDLELRGDALWRVPDRFVGVF
jgi:hypothetical protein